MHSSSSHPAFSFGVLADVQYADIPDMLNFTKTRIRYYRNSAKLVREAAISWKNDSHKPCFVVHLGDLIDGFNIRKGKVHSEKILKNILAEFEIYNGPVHHVLGNHDFYNFTRKELWDTHMNTTQLAAKQEEKDARYVHNPRVLPDLNNQQNECGCNNQFYYKFEPHPDFCFVVLDTYDISGPAHLEECPCYQEAMEILCAVNKNTGSELNSPTGLEGDEMRYVLYNGSIGKDQLDWLRGVLEEATRMEQKVFLLGHIPIFPGAACSQCLLWNYKEVLETLHNYDCVAAVLCGHTHVYKHAQDTKGIHHITFPGIVEVQPGSNAFATIDVYQDWCKVRGVGRMPSLQLDYAPHHLEKKNEVQET